MAALFAEAYDAARRGQPAPTYTADDVMSVSDQLALSGIIFAVALVYTVLFLRMRGRTPGKMVAGLRVVPQQHGTDDGPLSWVSVLARSLLWVAPQLSLCFVLFTLLDCLFPLWQPNRQAIHDLAARTQVISVRAVREPVSPPQPGPR